MKFKKFLILGFLLIALVTLPVSFAADVDNINLSSVNMGGTDSNLTDMVTDMGQSIDSEIISASVEDTNNINNISVSDCTDIKAISVFDAGADDINNICISDEDTIYVNASYNGTEMGTSSNPYKTINNGVNAFLDSDKSNLFIANGVYLISNSMDLNKNINIIGESTNNVIIDANGKYLFDSKASNLNIYNLTITNGCSIDETTIICGESSSISLYNIVLNNSQASNGGGLILNRNGNLNLFNCSILNANIKYIDTGINGGVIYTEGSNVSIINSSFNNVIIDAVNSNGGFIYVKDGNFEFINSTISNFSDVSPSIEGAFITFRAPNSYKSYIINSTFEKSHFTEVLGLIESFGYLLIDNVNISNNYANSLNGNFSILDHYSLASISNLNLFNNTFLNVSTTLSKLLNFLYINGYFNISGDFPSSYNLRDYGYVTPVKNQGGSSSCWAFASLAALESYLAKNWNSSFDLSENNMKNIMSKYGINGSEWDVNTQGGNDVLALAYLLRWSGAVNESDDPYKPSSTTSPLLDAILHVQDVVYIPLRHNFTDNDQIKYAIMNYGAVFTEFYASGGHSSNSFYTPDSVKSDHAVAIVGWDDNFSKDNFLITPPGDGAFIIKNSWGPNSGDEGYYYVSYYDNSFAGFATNSKFSGFVFTNVENRTNYDSIYYYDPFGNDFLAAGFLSDTGFFANQFIANDKEILSAFGFYTYGESNYSVNIYVNDKLIHTQNGVISNAGYHTIKLDNKIILNKNDVFKIEIKLTTPNCIYPIAIEDYIGGFVNATANPNESFVSADGVTWADLTSIFPNANVCIKAYTKSINPSKVYLDLFNATALGPVNLIAEVLSNSSACDGEVTFFVNGKEVATVELVGGIATYEYICGAPGTFTVRAVYAGNDKYRSSEATSTLVVNKIPITMTIKQNNTYYKSAFITITLSKAINNQKITLKFSNGKTATVSTNSKGVATYYVPFAVGSYTVTGSASNSYYDIKTVDSYKISIKKVTATITAYKLTTTYKSGKYFQVKVTNPKGQVMVGVKLKLKVYTGKKYKTVSITTGTNGIAKYSGSSLSIAKHKIIVSSAESTKYMTASSKTNYLTVKKGTTTVTAPVVKNKYKKSQYFKVTIKNKASGKLISGLYLKIKVYTGKKYKTYKVKTNSKGIAYLNTKALSKGSHKVVISTTSKYYSVSKSGYLIKIVK